MSATTASPVRLLSYEGTASRARPEARSTTALLGFALCAVPVSIAITEIFLGAALMSYIASLVQRKVRLQVPRIFWFWLPFALLEFGVWLQSADRKTGFGEVRHLLLVAVLCLLIPVLNQATHAVKIWCGIFVTATAGSLVLIVEFVSRWIRFRREIAIAGDPSFYLRTGGLLNHWAIYGTVEILVFAALVEYWRTFPQHRRRLVPLFTLQTIAIVLSLSRSLWLCCLLLLFLDLAWRRSRWIWAVPVLPALLLIVAPVRYRVTTAMDPSYYSNAERLQMLRVGAQMIREHPLTGVGPGRVEALYRSYLAPRDPVPAYHGHLHNNLVQLGAQFGLPVLCAALIFVVALFQQLMAKLKSVTGRESQFLCRTGLLGLTGFLATGLFDYTYGHSLGLILLSFVLITPLVSVKCSADTSREERLRALALLDRIAGAVLFALPLPIVIPAAMITHLLSHRSPFIAHLRMGKDGRAFWLWKLRTMWARDQAPSMAETGWVERIERDPQSDTKPENDSRVTSRFARFCRRYSIDEAPQFLHVLFGQMSLVGPRPLTRAELRKHYGASMREILALKPGLTGYWQTRGRNRLTYRERVAYDLELVRELSLAVYFRILLVTIPQVLRGENAW